MKDADKQLLQSVLKKQGYSLTKPRLAVCELLWNTEPQSMRDLTQQLNGRLDRASLYRTIDLFEKLGLVQRIYIGWKYKIELSDIFTHHHHHISCLSCGKVVPLHEEPQLETLLAQVAEQHHFTAQSHQLEISGYCQACQRATKAL